MYNPEYGQPCGFEDEAIEGAALVLSRSGSYAFDKQEGAVRDVPSLTYNAELNPLIQHL